MERQGKTFFGLVLLALLAWLLFGKRAFVTSRVSYLGEAEGRCPYWTKRGGQWQGLRGETVPALSDSFGPLASPPDPPWSPCYQPEVHLPGGREGRIIWN